MSIRRLVRGRYYLMSVSLIYSYKKSICKTLGIKSTGVIFVDASKNGSTKRFFTFLVLLSNIIISSLDPPLLSVLQ